MKNLWQGLRIVLEVIGVIALVWGGSVLFLRHMFKDFAGGNCTDTEQRILESPDGKHSVKSFHRVCGDDKHAWDFIYLSTGNPNPGYEYTPVVTVKDVAPGETSITWDGSSQVSVKYPASAEIGDAYAKVLDIRVVLNPSLPQAPSGK
ncbi:hypothetical protein [Granulicella sp. S156]|jgi:hypothetical protein|uniref:hypothetical protein n=1 Tax=Granulicella sp. S156 TaxID=1747224 RepID=UPI00131C7BDF|nr:hypothetical protein [Granulicella sp. S156]